MISRIFVTLVILYLAQGCLSKPVAESDITEGRGFGSTLWGWLTYPFSSWGSEPEASPSTEQLIASTSNYRPLESIEVSRHNVTVWCSDQTCTTQKCDEFGCKNLTCNIYETNLMGECHEYSIYSTQEQPVAKPTESLPKPIFQDIVPETTNAPQSTTAAKVSFTEKQVPIVEEHPLELEIVLSSTVKGNDKVPVPDKKDVISTEQEA